VHSSLAADKYSILSLVRMNLACLLELTDASLDLADYAHADYYK